MSRTVASNQASQPGRSSGRRPSLLVPVVPRTVLVLHEPLALLLDGQLGVLAHALAGPDDRGRDLAREVALGIEPLQVRLPRLDPGDVPHRVDDGRAGSTSGQHFDHRLAPGEVARPGDLREDRELLLDRYVRSSSRSRQISRPIL